MRIILENHYHPSHCGLSYLCDANLRVHLTGFRPTLPSSRFAACGHVRAAGSERLDHCDLSPHFHGGKRSILASLCARRPQRRAVTHAGRALRKDGQQEDET
jgi:hypothetical protein